MDIASLTTNGWKINFFGCEQTHWQQTYTEVENLWAQVQELQAMLINRDLHIEAYQRTMNEMMFNMKKKDEALERQGKINKHLEKHAQEAVEKVVDKREYIRRHHKEIKDLKKRLNEQEKLITRMRMKEEEIKSLGKTLAKKDDVLREQEKALKELRPLHQQAQQLREKTEILQRRDDEMRKEIMSLREALAQKDHVLGEQAKAVEELRSLHHQKTQELRQEMEILQRRDEELREENQRLQKQLNANLDGAKKKEGLRTTDEDILRLYTILQEPQRETSSLTELCKEIEEENESLRREIIDLAHQGGKRKEALTQRDHYKSTKFPQDTNANRSDVLSEFKLKARRSRSIWNLYENGLMTPEMEKSVDKKSKDTREESCTPLPKIISNQILYGEILTTSTTVLHNCSKGGLTDKIFQWGIEKGGTTRKRPTTEETLWTTVSCEAA
ncbi:golgin subfamily A member 6-like protein 1 [Macrobrachium rosenbergii]|uniref:golgin subfamily A member 6-like protein 1 n=1 Tax=Macrobrachium rosenbergii TaxID=79674 RepID=UPI0034D5F219